MKLKIKNPHTSCEYCKLLAHHLGKAKGSKIRTLKKRYAHHVRALHNPVPAKKKMMRRALVIAKALYKHFKDKGVPAFIFNRLPGPLQPSIREILKYNGVRVNA